MRQRRARSRRFGDDRRIYHCFHRRGDGVCGGMFREYAGIRHRRHRRKICGRSEKPQHGTPFRSREKILIPARKKTSPGGTSFSLLFLFSENGPDGSRTRVRNGEHMPYVYVRFSAVSVSAADAARYSVRQADAPYTDSAVHLLRSWERCVFPGCSGLNVPCGMRRKGRRTGLYAAFQPRLLRPVQAAS